MKRLLFVFIISILATGTILFGGEPLVSQDKEEVFKRAFWKRPNAADKILHAELREWTDAKDLFNWQWFIVVVPSNELLQDLREDNTFSLVPNPTPTLPDNSPDWFSFDHSDFDALKAPDGNRQLFFGKTRNILFATDSGGAFKAGAPEPVKPAAYAAPTGRIPRSPPPIPEPEAENKEQN